MKPQRLQQNDSKKAFRDAALALSNPSAFNTGREYREALNDRTAATAALFREGVINDNLYQELLLSDDYSWIPDPLK